MGLTPKVGSDCGDRVHATVLSFGSLAAVIGMFAPWLTVGPTSWSSLDLRSLVFSGVFGVLGALYAGVVAFAVTRAPEIVPFDTEWGVTVTFVGAVVVFVASVGGFVLAATDRR